MQIEQHQQAFRLGALLTEQPHPATRELSLATQRDASAGIRMLQRVDRDIIPAAQRAFGHASYAALVGDLLRAMRRTSFAAPRREDAA